jgi:hypothetical protein
MTVYNFVLHVREKIQICPNNGGAAIPFSTCFLWKRNAGLLSAGVFKMFRPCQIFKNCPFSVWAN